MEVGTRMVLTRLGWLTALWCLAGAGCSDFAAFQRADAQRNAICVRVCEQVLVRPSLALSDGNGDCACYALAEGVESSPGVLTARIHVAPPPARPVSMARAGGTVQ